MGCHVLELEDGRAVLHDSVTETVFGPIFEDEDQAEDFIKWCIAETGTDPRALHDDRLLDMVHQFGLLGIVYSEDEDGIVEYDEP